MTVERRVRESSTGRRRQVVARLAVAAVLACGAIAGTGSHGTVRAAGVGNAAPAVIATGLDNPRGLAAGPEGALYVALAGSGLDTNPVGPCSDPGSATGAGIVKITRSSQSVVTTGLPSSYFNKVRHVGAADIAFIGSTMYVLEEGRCVGGNVNMPNGIYRVSADGTLTLVADLGQFYLTHPVKTPDASDFVPSGNPYHMTAMDGSLYVAEANHAEIDKVDPATGAVTRLLDFSQEPWLGVAGIAAWHGSIYFNDLTENPFVVGAASIYKLNADGSTTKFAGGLTAAAGLTVANNGTFYVAEFQTKAGKPTTGTGAVARVSRNEAVTQIASGLFFPTGIAIAPDGGLDVSDYSEFGPLRSGEILHIRAPEAAGVQMRSEDGGVSARFTVSFTSANPGNGAVYFGTGPGCSGLVEVATQDSGAGTTNHTVTVTGNDLAGTVGDVGIIPGTTYWYETVTTGSAGQETDNNGGPCYSVTIA